MKADDYDDTKYADLEDDVGLDEPLPFDPYDETPEPDHPTWLWARLPSSDPQVVIWRRCFAGEEPEHAIEYRSDPNDPLALQTLPGPAPVDVQAAGPTPAAGPAPGPGSLAIVPDEPPVAIKVEEAAAILGIDRNTLYTMLKQGDGPPFRRCGTSYRLDRAAVREWLRAGDPAPSRRRRAG